MKRFTRGIITLFLISVLAFAGYGQISQGGSPLSFSQQSKSGISPQIPVIEMPYVDVDYLRTEDLVLDQIKNIPWRFGFNIDVKIDVKSDGLEQIMTDGSKLWRVEIYSPGAVSINLMFDEFQIPPGAELFIYNDSKTDVIGAFTDFNNRTDSIFATIPLRGDHITIEYYEPVNPVFSGVLHLSRVTHGYRGPHDFAKAFGSSGSCNVNVACPESAGMEDQIRSAAMLVTGGSGFCSGSLINNTNNNGTPYFLSADHCYTNPSSVVFWFNWQSPTCSNPPSSPSYQSISGATTRARYSTSDMWLMELSSTPPSNYNVFYSGWNRTIDDYITGKIWGIHHPAGDIKKISWSTLGVSTTTYLQNPVPGNGTHWRVTQWSDGTTTEGGSSGSPLFDPNGRIIGQLHGGYASCSSLTSDWYGKLGVSWTGGGTNATRLSNWLDPLNSGVETLDGYDPNLVTCNPPTNQASGFSATSIGDHQMTVNWARGNGTSVLVVARQGSPVSVNPGNGINYTANSVFGSGSETGGGSYVVYKGTGTNVTVTNLQPGTTYHYAIYEFFTADNCYLTPGLAGNATTTGQAPCTYCTVSASTDDNTGVTRVQFNTIDNVSVGAPAYTDFTNISTTLNVGQSYDMSVRVNTDGQYTVQTRAWIDWNQNCLFDQGEEYNLGSAVNVANGLTSLSPLSITVPAGALTGPTTMRIRAVYGTSAIPAACGNQNYSEAEDYTIIVQSGTTCPVPTGLSQVSATNSSATVQWTGSAGEYAIEYGTAPHTFTGIGNVTGITSNSATISGLLPGTVYEYKVKAICGPGDESNWSSTGIFQTESPELYVNPGSIDFGYIASGSSSPSQTFLLSGLWLYSGPVLVSAPSGFQVSLDNSSWQNFVNVNYTAPNLSPTTIYVRFSPSGAPASYSGDVTNVGGGGSVNVAVTGSSIQTCDFEIIISGSGFLDETTFTLTNSLSTVVLSGGPFASSSSNSFTHQSANPPYVFYLETMGNYNDNVANYVINANGAPVFSGTLQGGQEITIDDIYCIQLSNCLNPTNLNATGLTQTTADLFWTGPTNAVSWDVELGPAGFTPNGTPTQSGITNPYTYSSLTSGTMYDYYVRAFCGGTDYSDWIGPFTFSTLCPAISSFPYTEDFSGGYVPPLCWSANITNTDYTWYYSAGLEYSTCQYDPALVPQDEWLISPTFDFTALTHPKLSFDWAMSYYWGVDPFDNYDLVCHVSTDGGIIWDQVWEEADEGVFSNYMWATKTIDLIAYAGQPQVMIAWQYVGVDGAQANLDSIIIFNDPPPVKTLNVTTFIEGLYDGSGTMRKAQDVDPVTWMYVDKFGGDTADVVTIELVTTTGGLVFTQEAGISTTGVITLDIASSYSDSYYIYIRHRNSIAISSANPVSFAGSTITYNFSTAAIQAYSDNQQNLGSGVFGLFAGDVDQDGSVGAFDLILVDNASKIFLEGYIPEDVNGDAEVGAFDLIFVDNNSRNFVFEYLPF
jgi:lysyl endopeptidase